MPCYTQIRVYNKVCFKGTALFNNLHICFQNDPQTILKCQTIISEMLQILKLSSISPTLQMMIESQVYVTRKPTCILMNHSIWFETMSPDGSLYISRGHRLGFPTKDVLKDLYPCPIEIIKGLTDKEQFQYLTKLKGPQEGTYLHTTQFLSLR